MPFERPDIIRPPSEGRSYFLPVTSGCSNNTCAFCNFYGSKLRLRAVDDIKLEIEALYHFTRSGVCLSDISDMVYIVGRSWDGKRVFLQDGDALVYPFAGLKEVLQHLNQRFPSLERVAAYATAQDILRRSPGELKELKGLKLDILYMGVESGDAGVLGRVGKGVGPQQMIEAGKRVKEAGIALSVTVILGLGGVEGSERHALETARVLSEMDPDYVGALTLMLVPGTPLHDEWEEKRFSLVSPFGCLKELLTIVENSHFSDCFFSSMHASNYFALRGRLPQDRERMFRELREILAKRNPTLLRPEFLRGL